MKSPKFAAGCVCYYCGMTQPAPHVKQPKPIWINANCPHCKKDGLRIVAPLTGFEKTHPVICGECGNVSTITAVKTPTGYRCKVVSGSEHIPPIF